MGEGGLELGKFYYSCYCYMLSHWIGESIYLPKRRKTIAAPNTSVDYFIYWCST